MGLKGFERRLERLVEGVFAKTFKSSLRPVELGRRLIREMDDQRTVNVQGGVAAPNHFTITVGRDDYTQFAEIEFCFWLVSEANRGTKNASAEVKLVL